MISQNDLENAVSGKKLLIDTNIIIYLTEGVEPYADLSRILFELVENGQATALFSIISIAEVMQGPLRRGLVKNAMEVKEYLLNFPNASCQEINGEVLDQIGRGGRIKWSKLRMVDSLIIASGLINEVELFISNDTHFLEAIPEKWIISFL